MNKLEKKCNLAANKETSLKAQSRKRPARNDQRGDESRDHLKAEGRWFWVGGWEWGKAT